MNTAVVNVKVDPVIKIKAHEIAKKLGFSLSSLINGYLKQLIKIETVVFSTSEEIPTEYMLKALEQNRKERERGEYSPSFDNAEDAITWLNNPKKKYERKVR